MLMTTRASRPLPVLGLLVVLAAAAVLASPAFASEEHGTTPPAHGETHEAAPAEAPAADGHTAAATGDHGDTHATDAHAADAHAHESHAAVPHLQNGLSLLIANMTDAEGEPTPTATFLRNFMDPIFSLLGVLILGIFFVTVGTRLRDRDPGRVQMFAETIVGGLYGMFEQVLGDQARRFTPYLGTLFLFILVNNWLGMVPFGHASTSSFANTTIGLGVLTFFYVQYVGIKENGLGGYLYHFAGQPKSGIEWGFAILIFPLELMGELIKPLSLSLRLFGNIFGEDTLIAVMVMLGTFIVFKLTGNQWIPGIPLQFPFYFLGLLASTVQALVFTILSTIYIALMLPHHDHEEAAHGHAAH